MEKSIYKFQTKDELYTHLKSTAYTEPFVSYVDQKEDVVYQNITFLDPEVERIVANTWGGGKTPVSLSKIIKVTSIDGTFFGNTAITTFDEFEHFVSVTDLTYDSVRGCFGGCSNLTSIKFPESLRTINNYCFDDTGFSALTFNEGLTTLRQYAFNGYSNLVYIELPTTLTTIERNNFRPAGINLPTKVVFRGATPPSLGTTADVAYDFQYYGSGGFRNNTAAKIYVPYSSDHSILQAYQNDSGFASLISRGINIYELDEDGNVPQN